jgi:hypothetical protein
VCMQQSSCSYHVRARFEPWLTVAFPAHILLFNRAVNDVYAGRQVAAGAASSPAWQAWTDCLPQWTSSTLNLPPVNTADRT